jgi:hypothetical protein
MTAEEVEVFRDWRTMDKAVQFATGKLKLLMTGSHYAQIYPTRSYTDTTRSERTVLQEHLRYQFHRRSGEWITDPRSAHELLAARVMAVRMSGKSTAGNDTDILILQFATQIAQAALQQPNIKLETDREAIIIIRRFPENFPTSR